MAFVTRYGYTHSENGWRMCDDRETETFAVDNTVQRLRVRKGDARVILEALAVRYHRTVEPIDKYRLGTGDDWGYSSTNDVPNSNHMSGTGEDFNATQYPWGRKVMPSERVVRCERLAKEFEGVVFWGRWWAKPDEMHWQIALPEGDPRIAAFAAKLRGGYLGVFAPEIVDPDAFPLPLHWYFGPLDGPNESISNIWEPRADWVAALKRWQIAAGIPASGVFDAATQRAGEALQIANGWPTTGRIYEGEWNVVIRHGQKPNLSAETPFVEYVDASQWQSIPIDQTYPFPVYMFRVNNGNEVDRLAAENLGKCAWLIQEPNHPMQAFGVYTFWRPGADNLAVLKRTVGVPHPRMFVMIDVENARGSAQGEVRGDQSKGVNQFLADVAEWLGDPKRVRLGYLNAVTDSSLWPNRPTEGVRFVIPDYSAPKGKPRTTYPGWMVHQYTQTGKCAPFPGPVCLNYFDGPLTKFLHELGLPSGKPGPLTPPPVPEPTPKPETPVVVPDVPPAARIPFPLDTAGLGDHPFYGPLDGPYEAVSGKWSGEDPAWAAGLRKYQARLNVPVTGIWESGSPTDRATREVQRARGWPESGYVYRGEWNAVMNGDHPVPGAKPPTGQPTQEVRTVSRKVKDLTGPGTSAANFGVGGTDLGIVRRTPAGFNLYTFGDTFDQFTVGGPGWRSPVMLRSPAYNGAQLDAGVSFDTAVGGNYAKQVLPYTHNVGFSTVLPTDVWTIREYMFMHVMVIGFGGLSDVLWTEMHYSLNNGDTWQHAGSGGRREGGDFDAMFQMLTVEHDPVTGWCYAISARGLARNSGAYLWRFRDVDSTDKSKWEGWGWNGANWGWGRYPSNIMPQGVTVGELNLRKVQNNWVFTYFETNTGRIVSKVLASPNSNIAAAPSKIIVTNGNDFLEAINPGNFVRQPYGGYLIDGSTLDNPHYVVSQWNTVPGQNNWPYRSMQFEGTALTPVNPI